MEDELEREFEDFVRETREGLVALGMLLTGDVSAAQDLAQETLVRAWQRWRRLRSYERPAAWSRRVLHNLAVDRARRRVREQRYRSERRAPSTLQIEDEALLEAIRGLDPKPRSAVFLHYFVGLPIAEIAAELGAPAGTVGSWLSRSRASIAEQLDSTRRRASGGGDGGD